VKVHLTRRYLFSASHRLHSERFSDEQNRATYGKCNNPYGHGHNYALEVTVSGPVDEKTGMVCSLSELDRLVQEDVLAKFDHENLNTRQEFAGIVPTTENLSELVFNILKQSFKAAHLEKVRIEETMMNSFEYSGDAALKA
jgi:6-pyruvoyltetrahydropterin/6-carboxytetrahydropterin synthase